MKANVTTELASKASKTDVAGVNAKLTAGFLDVTSKLTDLSAEVTDTKASLRQEYQEKLDAVVQRYEPRIGALGDIVGQLLNTFIQNSTGNDLEQKQELLQYLIDSMESTAYVDEVRRHDALSTRQLTRQNRAFEILQFLVRSSKHFRTGFVNSLVSRTSPLYVLDTRNTIWCDGSRARTRRVISRTTPTTDPLSKCY